MKNPVKPPACIFLLVLFVFSGGCGVVQTTAIEGMSHAQRMELLESKATGELCNAFMHPLVKEQTARDLQSILQKREIETCYKLQEEKTVYSAAAAPAPAPELVEQAPETRLRDGEDVSLVQKREALPLRDEGQMVGEAEAVAKTIPSLPDKRQATFAEEQLLKEAVKNESTDSMDVADIIPGVSSRSQVQSLKKDAAYIIGGLSLLCIDSYINNRVSDFSCLFGEKSYSRDLVAEESHKEIRLISNTEVYEKLLYGFTKKFKAAPEITTEEMVNGFGVKSKRYIATWRDAKGNALYLRSVERNVNEGTLILRSAEYMEAENKKVEEESQRRKF